MCDGLACDSEARRPETALLAFLISTSTIADIYQGLFSQIAADLDKIT